MHYEKRRRFVTWCLGSCLARSVSVNIAQVLEMRSFVRRCAGLGGRAEESGIGIGTHAPSLNVHDLSGRPVAIPVARPGKMTVTYVFSPSCSWCVRNVRNMQALIRASGPKYDFVPVSLVEEGVREFWSKLEINCPVYVTPEAATRRAFGLSSTPHTVVTDPDGVVLKNWRGAYTGRLAEDVGTVLSVRLPGLGEGD